MFLKAGRNKVSLARNAISRRTSVFAANYNSAGKRSLSSNLPSTKDDENQLTVPIDFAVSSKIEGEESQIATVTLKKGEKLRAESGAMLYMTQGVEMATSLEGASSAWNRMMTGQNMFLTDFTYTGPAAASGTVALGTDFPSKILRLSLQDFGGSLICQKGAYLASNITVDIQMEFTKTMSAGFFGGQGFILQRLSGDGDVLIKAGGTLVERTLEEGQVLRCTSGSIVAFEPSVEYDIQMMQGVKNVMFGGEGLFVTSLKGPGRVWLQGMPPDRMIAEIASRVPSRGGGIGPVIPIGGMGGGGEAAPPVDAGVPMDGETDAVGEETAAAMGNDESLDSTTIPSSMDGDSSATFDNTFSEGETFSETTFTDDGADFAEPTFDDETTSFGDTQSSDFGGDWGDDSTEIFESGGAAAEEAAEGASNLLQTLWDIFTGD